ncbi:hypothetical protein M413DRAFT_440724 [Hebeloma cylindrosporum]|uniref:Uncharacterized protein n=1 Tax=Hebeloma cylindrosporum TaxID=76867 RepID=A0A0C3CTP7_HEBCY|nr:hypothetical protein M413DRAFT_440724 [Hebeloma cylindrosporum h7]
MVIITALSLLNHRRSNMKHKHHQSRHCLIRTWRDSFPKVQNFLPLPRIHIAKNATHVESICGNGGGGQYAVG